MDNAWLTILATLIGAGAGIGGGLLGAYLQARLEREKAQRAREEIYDKETREAMQQLTVHLAAAIYAMCWLTWHARHNSTCLTREHIASSEKDGGSRRECHSPDV
jgi:hypothetical protein